MRAPFIIASKVVVSFAGDATYLHKNILPQKPVVSSTSSNNYGNTIAVGVPKASQSVPLSVEQSAGSGLMPSHPDPTRFGDWERAGRCIDF